jgi:hypothetical protein
VPPSASASALAREVNALGDDLFAGPGLAEDQNGERSLRHLLENAEDAPHLRRRADELAEAIRKPDVDLLLRLPRIEDDLGLSDQELCLGRHHALANAHRGDERAVGASEIADEDPFVDRAELAVDRAHLRIGEPNLRPFVASDDDRIDVDRDLLSVGRTGGTAADEPMKDTGTGRALRHGGLSFRTRWRRGERRGGTAARPGERPDVQGEHPCFLGSSAALRPRDRDAGTRHTRCYLPSLVMAALRKALVFMAVFVAVVAGCKKKTPEEDTRNQPEALAEDGADTSAAEADAENLVALLQPDPGSMAEFGEPAARVFIPRGCVSVARDLTTRTVTLTFDRCTGQRGLFGVSGEVKATYSASPREVAVDLVATDLTINGATVDWTAHASIVTDGLARTMTWRGQLAGKTRRGREFTRTNEHRISWTVGQPCIAFEGRSEGDVAGRGLRAEVTGLSACRGGCPDNGGRIVVTNLANQTRIEIRFDGTQMATYVDPNGRESRFRLLCRA